MTTNRSFFMRIVIFALSVFFIAYLGYQTYKMLNDPVKTVEALYVTVDDSISTEGYFIRDEHLISGQAQGVPVMRLSSGEKVAKNEIIAVYYKNESARADSERLLDVERQIEDLSYVLAQAANKPDNSALDRGIVEEILKVGNMAEEGSLSRAGDSIRSLKSLVLRRNLVYGDVSGLEETLAELQKEQRLLKTRLSGEYTPLISPEAGYFTEQADGYEGVLSTKVADQMTPEVFDSIPAGRKSVPGEAIGRVAESFKWKFVVCLSEEQAARIEKGAKIRLRFSQIMNEDVWTTVEKITFGSDGRAVVTFVGSEVNEELLSARGQPVDIVLARYQGVKVPKIALRQMDEKWGVYCLSGQLAVFKEIHTIYETDSYYIVETPAQKTSDLFIHDEIIVSGKGVRNKQVVKE